MRKSVISLIVVLIVTTILLVGCSADSANQRDYQSVSEVSSAVYQNTDSDINNGYGNDSNANSTDSVYVESRGYGNGGYARGQQIGGNEVYSIPDSEENSVVLSQEPSNNEATVLFDTDGYGSSGALTDKDLTLGEMLTYAIQDEYLAHAEYVYIINAFGSARPFSNIIKAEEQHIEALLPLFTEYGIKAPSDTGSDHTVAVPGLLEAYQAGEKAEIDNIAMYNAFLNQDLPEDVRVVFESLRNASENHLAAFRNHL